MIKNISKDNRGFILLELIISIALFAVFSISSVVALLNGLSLEEKSSQYSYASNLSQEGLEAVRSIKNRAWNELVYDKTGLLFENQWELAGEASEEQIGRYRRYLEFERVYRNTSGDIVLLTSPGAMRDINSFYVYSRVFWENNGKILSTSNKAIFSNWQSALWSQNSWSGGDGQEIYFDTNKFFGSDNLSILDNLKLEEVATSTFAESGYLISSAYGPIDNGVFSSIVWNENIPDNCSECIIKVFIKTADNLNGSPVNWTNTWSGPDGDDNDENDYYLEPMGELISVDHNGEYWIKYKVVLEGPGDKTPSLQEIKIFYR